MQSNMRSCRRLRVVANDRPPRDLHIEVRPMRVHVNRVPVHERAAAQLCTVPLESRTTLSHPLPCTQGEETEISFLLRLAALSGTLLLCARGYGHPHPTHVVRWMNCRCTMGPHYPAFTVVISLKSKENPVSRVER